jgi:hypothetical protein
VSGWLFCFSEPEMYLVRDMKIILIVGLFLVSCSTLKQAKPLDNQITLTKENITQLNGEYEIFSGDSGKASLDVSLLFKKYWWGDFDNKRNYKLSLKAVDKQQLQVNVFKSGKLIDSKTIHYKIQDGALLIKRKKIRCWVIINGYGTMHTRLRVITSGELIIDHSNYSVAGFLIIPTAGENVNDEGIVFQKRRPD